MAKKSIFRKWWLWALVAVVVIGIASGTGKNENGRIYNQGPSEGNTAQQPTPKDESIKAGMYKVGEDIAAGEYVLFADQGIMAYYQVSKDSSGRLESIITNDNFYGTRYVSVVSGQYLELKNSKMLPIEKAPVLQATDNKFEEGMYKVGRDLPAGEYKVIPDRGGSAYVEVSKDASGQLNSIVSNDNFDAEKYITVNDGQYIKLVSCYLSKRA